MRIAIVSLHFGPGHIAHLEAWYKLVLRTGNEPILYVVSDYKKYLGGEYHICETEKELESFSPSIAIVYNFGKDNISFAKWCKRNSCKFIYTLHEPYMGLKELLKEGSYIPKQLIAGIINIRLCHLADRVIVCSNYAYENVIKYTPSLKEKSFRFPLIFEDEYRKEEKSERKYFSLLGAFGAAHGSEKFIEYMKTAYINKWGVQFQICTRTNIDRFLKDPIISEMIESRQLIVIHGRPLTQEEMNNGYRNSICVWNGYIRSTQSGVLPHAMMQGTPVIATKLGSFEEFVTHNENGVLIEDLKPETIQSAYEMIHDNVEEMSKKCREFFINKYYYINQVDTFNKLIEFN